MERSHLEESLRHMLESESRSVKEWMVEKKVLE